MDKPRNEQLLIQQALSELQSFGVRGQVDPTTKHEDDDAPAAVLTLQHAAGTNRFAVLVKRIVRPSSVALVARSVRAGTMGTPVILVTEHVSHQTAQLLRERGIPFIDASGNA